MLVTVVACGNPLSAPHMSEIGNGVPQLLQAQNSVLVEVVAHYYFQMSDESLATYTGYPRFRFICKCTTNSFILLHQTNPNGIWYMK